MQQHCQKINRDISWLCDFYVVFCFIYEKNEHLLNSILLFFFFFATKQGVGFAVDLVVCTCLGVDMFDCVYPSRTARFGTALVPWGTLRLKSKEFVDDFTPIDKDCGCKVCLQYTRAFFNSVLSKQVVGVQLLTYHNIAYQMRLMRELRESIVNGSLHLYVQEFFEKQVKGEV